MFWNFSERYNCFLLKIKFSCYTGPGQKSPSPTNLLWPSISNLIKTLQSLWEPLEYGCLHVHIYQYWRTPKSTDHLDCPERQYASGPSTGVMLLPGELRSLEGYLDRSLLEIRHFSESHSLNTIV